MQLQAMSLCLVALVIAAAAICAFLLAEAGRRRALADVAALRDAKAERDAELAGKTALLGERASALDAGRRRLAELDGLVAAVNAECGDLRTQLAALRETLAKERLHAAEKQQLLADARESMTKEFRLLAEDVMTQHGERFGKQNKDQIDGLLQPVRDKLAEFQQGLQTAHVESAKERATLGEQIRGLSAASAQMATEATNLTRALKGQAQAQGAWGEMILESVLERSGLRKGAEYVTQASGTADNGQRLRPDVIVKLPGEEQRRVVIDAKVSLVAFDGHVNATTDEDRGACLRRHLDSLRAHIKTLGSKDYLGIARSSLDFVIMFVPIEGALAVALSANPDLINEAAEHNVTILTPTTLTVALRTVASVWQAERRNQNADEIAKCAGLLYDKFHGVVSDMRLLEQQIGDAGDRCRTALGKLKDGKGNVVWQIERLKRMGARTGKSLPADLLDDAGATAPLLIETVTGLTPTLAGHAEPLQG